MKRQYGDISLSCRDHVALLNIDRPPFNFVSTELIRDLAEALEAIDADPTTRGSVLTTSGKNFCAGADFAAPANGTAASGMEGARQLYVEAMRLFAVRKPMISAIQGAAVGAGLGLALVADFRVAVPEARFCANFVKLAFHPGFAITHTLPRLIGQQRAALMCLTGRRVKGDQALAWGLADLLVPLDCLHDAAFELAREIAENAPLAVVATRATLRSDSLSALEAQVSRELGEQAALRATADFSEGVLSVKERRPGRFIGA